MSSGPLFIKRYVVLSKIAQSLKVTNSSLVSLCKKVMENLSAVSVVKRMLHLTWMENEQARDYKNVPPYGNNAANMILRPIMEP